MNSSFVEFTSIEMFNYRLPVVLMPHIHTKLKADSKPKGRTSRQIFMFSPVFSRAGPILLVIQLYGTVEQPVLGSSSICESDLVYNKI